MEEKTSTLRRVLLKSREGHKDGDGARVDPASHRRARASAISIGALAALIPMAVTAPLTLGVVTMTGDGWVPYPLASDIGTPYKDFFFPAPPGELWFGRLMSWTPDPLLAWHIVGIFWVGIFSLSVYMIARRFTGNGVAFVGAMVGSAIWISNIEDRAGGWNQQYISTLWLGTALLVSATDLLNEPALPRPERAASRRPEFLFAAVAGLFFAISALAKQTAIPSFALVIAGSALWTLFLGHRRLRDWLKWTGGGLALGLGLPAAATLIWLAANGAVSGFFESMSRNGGKGSPASQQISFVSSEIGRVLATPQALFVTAAFVVLCVLGLARESSRAILRPIVVSGGAALVYLAIVPYTGATNGWTLPFVLLIAAYLYIEMRDGIDPRVRIVSAIVVIVASIGYAVYYHGGPEVIVALVRFQGVPFPGGDEITYMALGILLVGGALFEAVRVAPRTRARAARFAATTEDSTGTPFEDRSSNDSGGRATSSAAALAFAATWGLAIIRPLSGPFVLAFVSGGVAIGVAWIIHVVRMAGLRLPRSISVMIVVWAILISVGFVAKSYARPYSWWGWEEPRYTLDRVQPEGHYLRNFRLSPESAAFYDNLEEVFSNLRRNLPSNATAVTYPHIPIGVNLSGFKPIRMKCPVVFWDLCPDDFALESLNQLKAAKPDVLIWSDPPEFAKRYNELSYRGGKLASLHAWDAWLDEVVGTGTYTLVGQVTMPGTKPVTGWDVSVYARTDALGPDLTLPKPKINTATMR